MQDLNRKQHIVHFISPRSIVAKFDLTHLSAPIRAKAALKRTHSKALRATNQARTTCRAETKIHRSTWNTYITLFGSTTLELDIDAQHSALGTQHFSSIDFPFDIGEKALESTY
jgi:hypothetical protein